MEPTIGQLGLCGPVGTDAACAPNCCQEIGEQLDPAVLGQKIVDAFVARVAYPGEAVRSPRAALLDECKSIITKDRNTSYGEPLADFTRTADLWNALGVTVDGKPVRPDHVAQLLILLKMSRVSHSPGKYDNMLDIAGYAACGWECVVADEGIQQS